MWPIVTVEFTRKTNFKNRRFSRFIYILDPGKKANFLLWSGQILDSNPKNCPVTMFFDIFWCVLMLSKNFSI